MPRCPIAVARDVLSVYREIPDDDRRHEIVGRIEHALNTLLHMAPELLNSGAPWHKIQDVILYDKQMYGGVEAAVSLLRGDYQSKALEGRSLLSRPSVVEDC